MMSKREVKEELKQSEGDPFLRAALRQRARRVAQPHDGRRRHG